MATPSDQNPKAPVKSSDAPACTSPIQIQEEPTTHSHDHVAHGIESITHHTETSDADREDFAKAFCADSTSGDEHPKDVEEFQFVQWGPQFDKTALPEGQQSGGPLTYEEHQVLKNAVHDARSAMQEAGAGGISFSPDAVQRLERIAYEGAMEDIQKARRAEP